MIIAQAQDPNNVLEAILSSVTFLSRFLTMPESVLLDLMEPEKLPY